MNEKLSGSPVRLNRRRWLQATAAAASGPLTVSSLQAADDKAVVHGRIKQSVAFWCFSSAGEKWDIDKTCQVAKTLGCKSVELLGPKHWDALKQHGLVCAMASNGMPGSFTKGWNNPLYREELSVRTQQAIDDCAAAGHPNVIAFTGYKWRNADDPASGAIPRDEAADHCVQGLKKLAGHAEKKGVTICLEHLNTRDASHPMKGHPGYQGDDLDWMASIIRRVGSPRVKLLFDIYHVQIMHGDVIRRLEQNQGHHRPHPHRGKPRPRRARRSAGDQLPADHAETPGHRLHRLCRPGVHSYPESARRPAPGSPDLRCVRSRGRSTMLCLSSNSLLHRREFLHSGLGAAGLLLADRLGAAAPDRFDVVVVGGTPGGIAAAVTATRLGRSVALVEYHRHMGGMSASGLGKSDIEHRPLIQGLFDEFVGQVRQHYINRFGLDSEDVKLCKDGYYYEPSVAEAIFEKLIAAQKGITRMPYHQLESARIESGRLTTISVKDRQSGETKTLRARVFIDATYEGDLVAAAGAEFRLGREAREEFKEPHAGHIYVDWRNEQTLPGGTGKGDKRLQAYTYRLCLSSDPDNGHRLKEPPESYDRKRYLGYLDDVQSGRFGPEANTTRVALSIAAIPNRKTDVNMNPRGLGFVFVGENEGYVEADWRGREQIAGRIRNLTLGLLWFLQNDRDVPAAHRELAGRYHLARDEFTDNGHFPFQLYVREARRLVGAYTLTEADITNLREGPGGAAARRRGRRGRIPGRQFSGAEAAARRQPGAGGLSVHVAVDHPAVPDPVPNHGAAEARRVARAGGRLDHARRLQLDPPRANLDGLGTGGGHGGARRYRTPGRRTGRPDPRGPGSVAPAKTGARCAGSPGEARQVTCCRRNSTMTSRFRISTPRSRLFLALLLVLMAGRASAAEPYDLVIRNGRIVDGTGNPWFRRRRRHPRRPDRRGRARPAGAGEARDRRQGPGRRARLHRHALALRLPAPRRRQRPEQDPPGRDDGSPRRRQLGRADPGQAAARAGERQGHAGPRSATTSTRWRSTASPSTSPPTSASTTSGKACMGTSFERPTPEQLERDEEARRPRR